MAGNSTEPGRSVTSKVAAILMSFTSGRGHALVDLARQAGLPTSTAHRLARELTDRHLLERTDDGEFRVGLPLRMLSGETAEPPTLQERAPFVVGGDNKGSRRFQKIKAVVSGAVEAVGGAVAHHDHEDSAVRQSEGNFRSRGT